MRKIFLILIIFNLFLFNILLGQEPDIQRFPLKLILLDATTQRTSSIYRIEDSLYLPEAILETLGIGKLIEKEGYYIIESNLENTIYINEGYREVIYRDNSMHFSSDFIRHEDILLFPIDMISILLRNIYNYDYYLSLENLTFYLGRMNDKILKLLVSFDENRADINIYYQGEGQYLINKRQNVLEFTFLSGNAGYFTWASDLYPFITINSHHRDNNRINISLEGEDFTFKDSRDSQSKIINIEIESQVIQRPSSEEINSLSNQRPLQNIVIDPGHGGEDTGAVGFYNIKEKDIVLDIALILRNQIQRYLGMNVILTRDEDVYLSLEERTDIANKSNGDIFISLHANYSRFRQARGFEVFYANTYATDDDAYLLSQIENFSIIDDDTQRRGLAELDMVLWDLAQSEFLEESMQFSSIINEIAVRDLNIINRGVKQAPFYVLLGVNMPAALVEIGFITNREEARTMQEKEYQEKMANVIFEAIKEYRHRYNRRRGIPENQYFEIIPQY